MRAGGRSEFPRRRLLLGTLGPGLQRRRGVFFEIQQAPARSALNDRRVGRGPTDQSRYRLDRNGHLARAAGVIVAPAVQFMHRGHGLIPLLEKRSRYKAISFAGTWAASVFRSPC